ncbi:MAG: HIRAN domain-containing protein [Chloroflexi bacterium]|nr:HIRAN domain-containing protein [Chloroflexota bacterium]
MAFIEFIVAGTAFEDRALFAEMLRLGDELLLVRDPHNPNDVSAIQLILPPSDVVGHVPRHIAVELSFLLDRIMEQHRPVAFYARVFELLRDPIIGDFRISVTVDLPDDWVIHLRSVAQDHYGDVRAYVLEQTARASYVMLRCSAEQMLTARDVLVANGFVVDRSGFASRPASNGQRYAWFIRVGSLTQYRYADVHALLKRAGFSCDDEIHQLEQMRAEQLRQAQESLWQARRLEQNAKSLREQHEMQLIEKEDLIKDLRFQLDQLRPTQPVAAAPERMRVDRMWLARLLDSIADSLRPEQMLDVIEGQYPDRVVVLSSARSSAHDSEKFRHRRRLAILLLSLATDYWSALQMGQGDVEARKVFGDDYAAQESEKVEKTPRLRRKRTFTYEGRTLYMSQHLKIGVKDGSVETIRVHFAWDEPSRTIVIGHCGVHLPID